jgi:hypothetical protein
MEVFVRVALAGALASQEISTPMQMTFIPFALTHADANKRFA